MKLMSFPPVTGEDPNVLILGSMPGQVSLDQNQYYGNPNNAFWYIMSSLIGFSIELEYADKESVIQASPFALWDVLQECRRPGSLDSSIVRGTEIGNDIQGFLQTKKNISLIAFNGGAAATLFKRHCLPELNKTRCRDELPGFVQLPSTSAAYASMKKQVKYEKWRDALGDFL